MFNSIRKYIPVEDVFDSIQPFHIMAHLSGVAYFKLIKNYGVNRKCYKMTFYSMTKYGLCLLFYMVMFAYFGNLQMKITSTGLAPTVTLCANITVKVLALINMILELVFAKEIIHIVNRIDEIDKMLLELDIKINHWDMWLKTTWALILSFIYNQFMLFINYDLYTAGLNDKSLFYIILADLSSIVPFGLNCFILFQYCLYCQIIRVRYVAIHSYLKTSLLNYKPRPVWISEELQPDIKKQRKFLRSTSDSLFIVDTVASYHIKLADIAAILNQAFCVQLLLLITTSFLGIVTALFLIAINFKQPLGDDNSSYNFVFTAWAFSNTIALLVVVHTTCALCDEANKCPRILHKIRNNTNDAKLHTTVSFFYI
ncbi:invertebrate gustatory receptor [Holotrichia oblita]|uniref:Invertebrate gustatory receptor n=1 Tax=Holotrichia oblita TaxID=644536 RepID=A0ACB9STW8_HOLOL|nr:invertebrate gustatory receptor [Holotrichia oblita]